MDTINNIAGAASKAIWGEGANTANTAGEEPVSGERGAGTADDPYDKGNSESKFSTAITYHLCDVDSTFKF
jgi:hypothetical protein